EAAQRKQRRGSVVEGRRKIRPERERLVEPGRGSLVTPQLLQNETDILGDFRAVGGKRASFLAIGERLLEAQQPPLAAADGGEGFAPGRLDFPRLRAQR